MSDFEKLMGELQTLTTEQTELAKALPADNGEDEKKIQAAAEEGGAGEGGDGKGEKPADGADGDGDPMAKSFELTLDDGTKVQAFDGSEMLKSLSERVEGLDSNLAKALGQTVELIKGQGELIKSLTERVAKLSGEGRGRKAVLSVVEKPAATANTDTMAKSIGAADGVTPEVFFAKALNAQKEGRISGIDIAMAETCLNKGQAIPPSIVARVMQ